MPATFSTAITLHAVIDFDRVRRGPVPPSDAGERSPPRPGRIPRRHGPSTAEIERLTQIIIAEMVRAVRWRRGQGVGHPPPPEKG